MEQGLKALGWSLVGWGGGAAAGYLFLRTITRGEDVPESLLGAFSLSFWLLPASTTSCVFFAAAPTFNPDIYSAFHWGEALGGSVLFLLLLTLVIRSFRTFDKPNQARWSWIVIGGVRTMLDISFGFWGKVIFNDFQILPYHTLLERVTRARVRAREVANSISRTAPYRTIPTWRSWLRRAGGAATRSWLMRDDWADDLSDIFEQLCSQNPQRALQALQEMTPRGWSQLDQAQLATLLDTQQLTTRQRKTVIRALGFIQ